MFTLLWVIIFGCIGLFFYRMSSESSYMDKNKIIDTYANNKDIFSELVDYALDNQKNISIYENDMINANIDNKKIKEDCSYLSKKIKYRYIVEDNDTIEFIKQSNMGWGQGILYLKNKDKESKLPFMKELEHIEGNWYYFEATD